MIFATSLLRQDINSSNSNSNNNNNLRYYYRYLRDSYANHTKRHYTYQYMSYYNGDSSNDSDNNNNNNDDNNNNSYNSTDHSITTSVSIRVTPMENYYVSWSILWSAFIVASIIAAWQIYREHRIFHLRRMAAGRTSTTGTTGTATAIATNNTNTSAATTSVQVDDGDDNDDNRHKTNPRKRRTVDVAAAVAMSDLESVSTADLTRSMFRKLLLLAMMTRVVVIPVQIWSEPMWWQFVSDTVPEIVFASAWTVLVTFFVQLVGIATGMGTNTSPGFVISTTVYIVYLILILLQLFNRIASVLLYALMCCIYATLFGVVIYFCPRLINLMRPSLEQNQGLAIRLIVATTVCMLIFGIHCIHYARLVIAPPRRVYWWYQYGILELFPAIIFLFIMHPQLNTGDRSYSPTPPEMPHHQHQLRQSGSGVIISRVDSGSRTPEYDGLLLSSSSQTRRDTPLILQHKGTIWYGTATTGTNEVNTKI